MMPYLTLRVLWLEIGGYLDPFDRRRFVAPPPNYARARRSDVYPPIPGYSFETPLSSWNPSTPGNVGHHVGLQVGFLAHS